jgi:hypothetical protein
MLYLALVTLNAHNSVSYIYLRLSRKENNCKDVLNAINDKRKESSHQGGQLT